MTIAILQFLCYYSSMNSLPVRKCLRLENYDYSLCGAYFLTICVKDMYCLLSDIVGGAAPYKFVDFKVCWNIKTLL